MGEEHTESVQLTGIIGTMTQGGAKINNQVVNRVENARPRSAGAWIRGGRAVRVAEDGVSRSVRDNVVVLFCRFLEKIRVEGLLDLTRRGFDRIELSLGQFNNTRYQPIHGPNSAGGLSRFAKEPYPIVESEEGCNEINAAVDEVGEM